MSKTENSLADYQALDQTSARPRRVSIEGLTADIPAMPVVAIRAMRELGDSKINVNKIGDIIATDPALTSRILRLANSPVFGAKKPIKTVSEAAVLIGFSGLKSVLITASKRDVYQRAGLMEQMFWEHGLGCAIAARQIAAHTKACLPDEAFVGGLVHDIGRVILANKYRQKYEQMFKLLYNNQKSMTDFIIEERENFGATHMWVGRQVMEKWGLSPDLGEIVYHHHAQTPKMTEKVENPGLLQCVILANIMCQHLAIGLRTANASEPLYDSPFAQVLNLNAIDVANLVRESLDTFESEMSTFEI